MVLDLSFPLSVSLSFSLSPVPAPALPTRAAPPSSGEMIDRTENRSRRDS